MKPERIRTLQQLYLLMAGTRDLRARAVERRLAGPPARLAGPPARLAGPPARLAGPPARLAGPDPDEDTAAALGRVLESLRGVTHLSAGSGTSVAIDLGYEVGELEKDLLFLRLTEEAFLDRLAGLHPELERERRETVAFLAGEPSYRFFTDRDGTVNNYCGRYRSSVQPAWNGVFLSRFARSRCRSAVILTSAPLEPAGILEVSVTPRELFVYAGSKGREFLGPRGPVRRYPIEPEKQEKLDLLNRRLGALLEEPRFEIFGLIGSGLQLKFGQTTVARQDIHGSIPEEDSRELRSRVGRLVAGLDPRGELFRIEDTGLDLEVILTVEADGRGARDFDKGDGIAFIDRELGLGLAEGPNLVCGDTRSDVAMARAAMERSPDTRAVFVTRDERLKDEVAGVCPRCAFVSEPDTLVAALNDLGRKER